MTINDGYIKLGTRLLESASPPQVTSIYIPPKTPVDESTDEFGFVFLEDGSIGPFYVSLDDTRAELERRLVIDGLPNTWSFPHWLERDSLAQRALAIGLFNACSDHVMRRAGFVPTHVPAAGKRDPQPGETIGMVGYFRPLVKNLKSRGCDLIVLERQPERVTIEQGVRVATKPQALAGCRSIICTASTLINDSLDTLLSAATTAESFALIGPTASGLPDVLFAHGVTATGGIWFDDASAVQEKLSQHASWGKVGQKFELTPANYPGIDALLAQISRPGR